MLDKAKTHKWKIAAVVAILLLALILGLVLGGKGEDPAPTPVPPKPVPPGPGPEPTPPNSGHNVYYVDNSTFTTTKYSVSGQLMFNSSKLNDTNATQTYRYLANDGSLIALNPSSIPTGNNNNYTTSVNFEFS
jgi:hypothetical protein